MSSSQLTGFMMELKYTIVVTCRTHTPMCFGILTSREEATTYMNKLYENDLQFEGLSNEEIGEFLDNDTGSDEIYADESLGEDKMYRITSIHDVGGEL